MKKQGTNEALAPRDVLIVEDSATQAGVLKSALEAEGWSVQIAADGVAALETIRLNKPTIVVSDIRMPNMDGYALSRAIKTDPGLRDIPVVLLTSLSQSRDIIDAINSRADYYFLKQWSYDVLIAKIAAVLDSYQSLPDSGQGGLTVRFEGDSYTIEADAQQPLHLLLSTYEIAVQQSLELARSRDELRKHRDQLEATVTERTAALVERTKELGCLYAISQLVAEPCASIDAALENAVALIPAGFQHAEAARARIVFEDREFASPDFTETAWSISADIVLSGKTAGTVEVCYLEGKQAHDEGPFLKEEQELIVDVARQLGVLIKRAQAEQAVHASETRYRRLFESAKDGILILDAETGVVLDVNPFLVALLGFSHEQFLGKTIWELGFLRDIVASKDAFLELQRNKYVRYEDLPMETADGRRIEVEVVSNVYVAGDKKVIQCNIRDITERVVREKQQHLAMQVLATLNRQNDVALLVKDILHLIKECTGFEAVGIRLREGDDFPYLETNGFPGHFVEAERHLCARTPSGELIRDANGDPVLECMCGNVLRGRTDPAKPFFTERGSFWSNCTSELLASTTEKDRQSRTRNRCNGEGYESVALIPLRSGDQVIGLLQLNDHRKGMFTLEMIKFYEEMGAGIGIAVARKRAAERIQHLNLVLRAIRDVNQLIVRERDPQTLIQDACTILVEHRSYLSAIIILTDDKGCPQTYAHAGMTDTFQSMAARLDQGILPPCCECAKANAGDGVHRVTDRAAVCAACPVADCFAETDTMLVPLRHRESTLGFFLVAVKHATAADAEEESLFTEAAGDIAFALHSIAMEAEQHALEQQLVQAQKMESVGRLAGGVAHDFNNMLMGIMNYAELCRDKLEPDHPIREWLNEITVDAERSTKLTQQLLAFARKQIIAPKALVLNAAIESMLKLLRRLIGEDIAITWRPGPDAWQVKMDPVQVDQILANLAVNARDAIGGVGTIIIESSNATFDQVYCAGHSGAVPGNYALLTFSDSGCGMDKETLANIFEPFFTTKGQGEGTGLGLATVYGIVKQNNGFINVYSEPGKGTTFKIYLPRLAASEAAQLAVGKPKPPPRGNETVLVVEDEKSIRITVHMFLEDLGYTVLVAEAPEQALRLAAQHSAEIDLLITDVIMPGMSGRDLADRLLELRPAIKRLFISGFTADVIAQRGILDDGVNFLSKPFGRDALAHKVREVLEA